MKALTHVTNPSSKDGFALILAMLVVLIVGALATGAAMVGGNHVARTHGRGARAFT